MKVIALFAAAFVVLAPMSVATGFAYEEQAKYLRLASTVCMVFWGVLVARGLRSGPAVNALLAFVVVFVGAGLWSDLPHWALFNKGMFALTCLSGVVLGGSLRSGEDVRRALRPLGRVAIGAAFVVLFLYLRDPASAKQLDRLAVFGINANMLGQTAAPMLILCFHVFLHDRLRSSRLGAALGVVALLVVILATGSRGALGMAVVGCGLLVLPNLGRARAMLAVCLLAITLLTIVGALVDGAALDRATGGIESGFNRDGIWAFGVRKFLASPMIGIGWLHWGTSWGSVQNAYLQTLVEAGLLGGSFLLLFVLVFATRWLAQWRRVAGRSGGTEVAWLSAAFVAAVLLHGVAESSLLMGTTLNSFFLGLGTALADRMEVLSTSPAARPVAWKVVAVPRSYAARFPQAVHG